MRFAIFVLAGLIMTSDANAEENRVTVRGMSQRLQLTGWTASWQVQGEIVPPVHPLRGGNLLVVVRVPEESRRSLILWSRDGRELGRSALDIAGEIKAAEVFGNRLLVATEGDLVEIDTGGLRKVRIRSFVVPATKTTLYQLCPTGLWVIEDKAVSYFDLDGRPVVKKARPLVTLDKPPCPVNWGDVKEPCSAGLQLDHTTVIASEAGDLIIVDVFKDLYPYAGRSIDEVWPSTATVLDRNGAVITQKPWSWMKTRWEWFWFKEGSSHGPLGWPQLGGIVRTRYETEGISPGKPMSTRESNVLFLNRAKPEVAVSLLNRNLDSLWKKTLGNLLSPVVSPSWAMPILLHDKVCRQFISI